MSTIRIRQLIYAFFTLLFLGLLYGWSVFVSPLELEFGWLRAETSLIFSFSMSAFCIGGFMSGLILKKRPARDVLRLSAFCLVLGFFLSSRVTQLWHIFLSYGVLCGLGVGFGYNATLGMAAKWFPEKPGLCSGVLLMGYGLGGMLLGTGAALLISASGWRTTFLLLCGFFAVILITGSVILRPPTAEEAAQLPQRAVTQSDAQGLSPAGMIRRPSFWLLFFWALLLVAVGFSIISQAVPFAAEAGATAAVATMASGLISICNGLSRLLFGTLFDKLGRRKTILLDTLLLASSAPVLYAACRLTSVPLVLLGFLLLGTGYGGVPALVASSTNHMYGVRWYALNYGFITLHVLPASLLGPLLAGNIRMLTGSYTLLPPLLLLLCIPAAILAANMRQA